MERQTGLSLDLLESALRSAMDAVLGTAQVPSSAEIVVTTIDSQLSSSPPVTMRSRYTPSPFVDAVQHSES